MFFSRTSAVLALVPLAIATPCTQSNAIDWPFQAAGDDACANFCKNESNQSECLEACYATAQQGQCNAVGCKRSTLDCASDEVCFRYTDNSLLCLNGDTGEYVDDVGGHGNANSGVYTAPNGAVTTNLGDGAGATPTSAAAVATSASEATSVATPTHTHPVGAGGSSGGHIGDSPSSSSASSTPTPTSNPTPTPNAGVGGRHVETWAVGASGLLFAFMRNLL
ncbi:hypothetical protein F4808DRAFT_426777 [Astrocystis sublimbata]|nr:hypothetical protein F4808DRAFT_426777 [Astrocystis sublimbata]